MSVWGQWERREQLERERALVRMRPSVVAAITPAFIGRVGSSAILEAVDEALAQIVVAGGHLAEPHEVKALWITCARRRVIDDERSAESRHRAVTRPDGPVPGDADGGRLDLTQLTEDGRQRWRIQEILGVLRGDQRRWAEAWYDEVLSASRPRGGQPRGLPDALGWTPAKTKCVSRRARKKMAAFIDERASGAVCDARRALLDTFIMAGTDGAGEPIDDDRREAMVIHLAGCDECWAAWHSRRRALLGRCRLVVVVPFDAAAVAGHALSEKLGSAQVQASSLLARVGIGGAAAAGGGAATIGGKVTAACVGVVCAATAGGELVGVLPPIPVEAVREMRSTDARPMRSTTVSPAIRRAATIASQSAAAAPAQAPTATAKAAVRRALVAPRTTWARRVTPADGPAARATSFRVRAGSGPAASVTPRAGASFSPRPTGASPRQSFCRRGSFGC